MNIKTLKSEIRKKSLESRNSLSIEEIISNSTKICLLLQKMPEFRRAECVMLYASFKSEVDTAEIIIACLKQGKKVAVPCSNREYITPCEIKKIDDLVPGYLGIPEPAKKLAVPVEELDIIILPVVAFDINGNRIGYGKGYYDKFLAEFNNKQRKIIKIGLAFECQKFDSIPCESHDQKLDYIITENGVIKCQ